MDYSKYEMKRETMMLWRHSVTFTVLRGVNLFHANLYCDFALVKLKAIRAEKYGNCGTGFFIPPFGVPV